MKILVDKMPECPEVCLFSYINDPEYGFECFFRRDAVFNWHRVCLLAESKECRYLKVGEHHD